MIRAIAARARLVSILAELSEPTAHRVHCHLPASGESGASGTLGTDLTSTKLCRPHVYFTVKYIHAHPSRISAQELCKMFTPSVADNFLSVVTLSWFYIHAIYIHVLISDHVHSV